jgi:hypothetical protein
MPHDPAGLPAARAPVNRPCKAVRDPIPRSEPLYPEFHRREQVRRDGGVVAKEASAGFQLLAMFLQKLHPAPLARLRP